MAAVRPDVDEIKRRANIVDVVSEYVTLRKTGINYTGLCPFHKEKTPSFSVNADKQIFYCFGCGEGGDVLAFLMKINQMTFPEALRHLAGKVGIVLSGEYSASDAREKKGLREEIYRINQLAADYFAANLYTEAGKEARAYLGKRRIREEVIKTFRLGYAHEGWRQLRGFFEKKKVALKLLEKAGLLIPKGGEDFYDRFRGRLMFPIEGVNGNVIAFGGRSLGDEMPKYLNSPESPVYIKGKNLYGLSRAKEDIRRKNEAILVEGYFDFLQLWNAGIRNAVATLGTALTRDHLDLLRRYTGRVVVLFDPDEGGRNAVERSMRLFVEEKMHARIVVLPGKDDPDSFVMKFGKEALENLISRAQPVVDYYIDYVMGGKGDMVDNLDAIGKAVRFIVTMEDPLQRNEFIKRVSERLGIDQGLLKTEVRKTLSKVRKTGKEDMPLRRDDRKVDAVELGLLYQLMEHPEWFSMVQKEKAFDYLLSEDLKILGRALAETMERNGKMACEEAIGRLENGAVRESLLKLAMAGSAFEAGVAEQVFIDTIRKIKMRWFKERHKALKKELVQAQEMRDENGCKRILVEKEKLMREEKDLSSMIREK